MDRTPHPLRRRGGELVALDAYGRGYDAAAADSRSSVNSGTQSLAEEKSRYCGVFVGVPQRVGVGRGAPVLDCSGPFDSASFRLDGGSGDRALLADGMADFAVEASGSTHVPPDAAALPHGLASRPGLFGLWLDSRLRLRTELLAVDARVLAIGAQPYRYGPRVWIGVGGPACHTKLHTTRDGSRVSRCSFRGAFLGALGPRATKRSPRIGFYLR